MENDKVQHAEDKELETSGTTLTAILDETSQNPSTRRELLEKLENLLGGRRIVSYFTSFLYPASILPDDGDIIEGILQNMELSKGLTLIINSLGGDPLGAERIVRVCREYTKGDFDVMVPRSAKSAATMICLGANKIYMGPTSELGPIDPQYAGQSVWSVIEAYQNLMDAAEQTEGKVEPFLLQLQGLPFDASQIEHMRLLYGLAPDIAVKLLQLGMFKDQEEVDIRSKLDILLDPTKTKLHGRPIFREDAKEMGLVVENIELSTDLWPTLWELYERTYWFVSHQASKTFESTDRNLSVPAPSH